MPTPTRKNRVRNTLQAAMRELSKALNTAKTNVERERTLKEMTRIGKQLRTYETEQGAGTGLFGGARRTRKHKRKN